MKTIRRALAFAPLALAACGGGDSMTPSIDQLPRTLTMQEAEVRDASNTFAFGLLREAVRAEGPASNVVVSPLSVSMALGMAANGAAGLTLDSIKEGLGLGHQSIDDFNEGFLGLLQLLRTLDPRVTVDIANSAWARNDFQIRESFIDALETWFEAQAEDFDVNDLEAAKTMMNDWVADRTGGRIDDIVQAVTPLDFLFLINATYFLADWRTQFDPGETQSRPFQLEGGGSVNVPMMREGDMPLRIGWDAERQVQIGELPYGGDAFSMVLAVPIAGGLGDLVDELTPSVWAGWIDGLRTDTTTASLPRFELEYEAELTDVLTALGMGIAFDDQRADFSNLSPTEGLVIRRVRHKTYMKVDERGTEAAAATSVVIGPTSAPPSLIVDRPFLLAIRERLSGTILFVGAVFDPR